jgi:hypothetical protein
MPKKLLLAWFIVAAPSSQAWNYFHIGFCNYSTQVMEYKLTFNPFNDFYNNNIYNVPLIASIPAGNCTAVAGETSWSVSDDTTLHDHALSFRVAASNKEVCFTLINPWSNAPILEYQFPGSDNNIFKIPHLTRDTGQFLGDYTIQILQVDDSNRSGEVIYAYRNPTISNRAYFFGVYQEFTKTCQ